MDYDRQSADGQLRVSEGNDPGHRVYTYTGHDCRSVLGSNIYNGLPGPKFQKDADQAGTLNLAPYRYDVMLAEPRAGVFVTSHEEDADYLIDECDLIATTIPTSAHFRDFSPFSGRRVAILPRHDGYCEGFARKVARKIREAGAEQVGILRQPILGRGQSLRAWVAMRPPDVPTWDRNSFITQARITPAYDPAEDAPEPAEDEEGDEPPSPGVVTDSGARTLANYRDEPADDGKMGRIPLRPAEIDDALAAVTVGWPKRVGDSLFWESPKHEPVYLQSPARLFAWIDNRARVSWTKGANYISQERYYEHRRMHSECYEAIETLPHQPALPGIYYMHRPIPAPGGKLDGLLSFFRPLTDADRELIRAMILTLFWGGECGSRPAFLVTGPDDDPDRGRGVGKTKLVDIVSDELLGGNVDVSPQEKIEDLKTRLLSPSARQKRVCRLDNIKTLRFSWSALEGLITSPEISGRALYIGEGRRPNTLVWLLTLNGASLSKDMAQRVVPIKLDRPAYTSGWEESARAYAKEYRWEIIADALEILRLEPGPLATRTRWAAWEAAVLSKCDLAEECQALILERQAAVDDDDSERDNVREFFVEQLRARGHNPHSACVFLPSRAAAEWLSEATRDRYTTNRATAELKGLGIPELAYSRTNRARGWVWTGSCCPDPEPAPLGNPSPDWEGR